MLYIFVFIFNYFNLVTVFFSLPNPIYAYKTQHGRQCSTMAPTWPGSKAQMKKTPILCFSSTGPAQISFRP